MARKFDWGKVSEAMKKNDSRGGFATDESLYKPIKDKDGTANKVIRFLPPPEGELLPEVKIYKHSFKDVGGNYWENCPTTVGEPCPVCKENSRIWDEDKNTVLRRKRNIKFFTNILVVKDPECPANEGKVFKFSYGVKIHEKIMEAIEEGVNVFDYEEGANFKLKIKQQGEFPNYDSSMFSMPTPISLDAPLTEAQIDEIEKQLHPLAEIISKDKFKSYETLAKLFTAKTNIPVATSPDGTVAQAAPAVQQEAPAPSTAPAEAPAPEFGNAPVTSDDVADSDADFFKKLQQS